MTQGKSEREEEITLDKCLRETKYYKTDTKKERMHIQKEIGKPKNAKIYIVVVEANIENVKMLVTWRIQLAVYLVTPDFLST